MKKSNPFRLFLSYLIPSCIGMFLMAVNILIDGLFISRGVGSEALAVVYITVPIGIGGAALYSIALGERNLQKANHIFTHSLVVVFVITGIFASVSYFYAECIAKALGASGDILSLASSYLKIILAFAIFYVLENTLSIFIRNDGNPNLAMTGLVSTSIFNILLNYVFIFRLNMGIAGAAYSTSLATVLGFLVLLTHFLRKKVFCGLMVPSRMGKRCAAY
ncbi:MATE family efflux transporter [Bacillus glycinifermentans]|uniref:MATE family efflux transporter n=2 Tax=Bacillaceae TaxID=186817 RepID=UPI002351AAF4|nr:MATE family efflux transporter [Bacillus glycinifermentans]